LSFIYFGSLTLSVGPASYRTLQDSAQNQYTLDGEGRRYLYSSAEHIASSI